MKCSNMAVIMKSRANKIEYDYVSLQGKKKNL